MAHALYGRPVRGVVFDLDGTLVNTTVDFGLMKRRVVASLIDQGIPSSVLDGGRTTADNLDRAIAYLTAQGMAARIDEVCRAISEAMNQTELERVSETTAVAGARGCLAELGTAGLRIGLLTRGSRRYALSALDHAGLGFRFDATVCRDDFPEDEAKPNGKAMIRIAGMLGLRPADCVLVGDHAMDLSCARSASAGFIGVLSGTFGSEDWSRHGCDVVIDSVGKLPCLLLEQKS